VTSLMPHLVRCPECWSLNDEGSECWCRDVQETGDLNRMTYECGNCGYASADMYCQKCTEAANAAIPNKMSRCNRCFTITSLTDECPRCRSKVLVPVGADSDDPLFFATQFNVSAYKGPKRSVEVDLEKLGPVVILN